MHHHMPSKTGWPSLNVIFPPVIRLVLDDPKVTTPEIIDQIHGLILEDRRISAKSIAEQLGISREPVGSIIREDLDTRKLSVKWVPKCLNADQKRQWCQSSQQRFGLFFGAIQMISIRDWCPWTKLGLYHYDPETKQQSVEWRHSGSPRPKIFRVQKSAGKVHTSIFWDQDGILLIDYLPKSQTIKAEYYSSLLVQLKDILKEKRRGSSPRGSCSCTAHWALATQKTMAYLGFQCLDNPPYSPDLASSDYHLFPGLRKKLKGGHFSSDAEVIAAMETLVGRTTF